MQQEERPRPLCVLFKQRRDNDAYHTSLSSAGFDVVFEQVLSFEWRNAELLDRVLHERHANYSGLIFTSPRAAEALQHSFERCTNVSERAAIREAWRSKAAYCVGRMTASRVRSLCELDPTLPHSESDDSSDTGSAFAGSASVLAIEIVADHERSPFDKPLLFVCGNLALDVLPSILNQHAVPFEQLQVYETTTHAVSRTSSDRDHDDDGDAAAVRDWWVFFSPSGAAAVFAEPQVRQYASSNVLVAAIGATTARALSELGVHVALVAAQPTPEALTASLLSYSPTSTSMPATSTSTT